MTEQELIKKIDKLRKEALEKYGVGTRNKQQELDNEISYLDGQIKGIQEGKKKTIEKEIKFLENINGTNVKNKEFTFKEQEERIKELKQKIEEKIC